MIDFRAFGGIVADSGLVGLGGVVLVFLFLKRWRESKIYQKGKIYQESKGVSWPFVSQISVLTPGTKVKIYQGIQGSMVWKDQDPPSTGNLPSRSPNLIIRFEDHMAELKKKTNCQLKHV